MTERREVWITGVGLLTCLGEGLEAAWLHLERGDPPPYDDKSFAPYIVHPLRPMSFDKQIPKKSDQRQMETWQRVGVYAAGLALSDAGIAGNAESARPYRHDRLPPSGGERDIAVDTAILTGMRKAAGSRRVPQRAPDERSAPDLVPGAAAEHAGRQYFAGARRGRLLAHFPGRGSGGLDAVRVAQARIAAGQSEVTLVGGAYHGARWDVCAQFELSGMLLKGKFAPVWDRGPKGGIALATMGAFLVLESRDHAQARGARPRARIRQVFSDRKPVSREKSKRRCGG